MFEMKMLKGHISVYLILGVIGFKFRRIGNFHGITGKLAFSINRVFFHFLWDSNFSIVNTIEGEIF